MNQEEVVHRLQDANPAPSDVAPSQVSLARMLQTIRELRDQRDRPSVTLDLDALSTPDQLSEDIAEHCAHRWEQ